MGVKALSESYRCGGGKNVALRCKTKIIIGRHQSIALITF